MNAKYFHCLKDRFPGLADNCSNLISDRLISPFILKLPKGLLEQAQAVTKNLYQLRESLDYRQTVYGKSPDLAKVDPGNKSICMSYDFHVAADGQLKLIEVNTNAAFLLLGYLLYQCHQIPLPITDFSLEEFRMNCLNEAKLTGRPLRSVAIVDEAPQTQRLFIEFLVYEQLFKSFGLDVMICDPAELNYSESFLSCNGRHIDFVYNRTTDFYLENPNWAALREAYQRGAITLSPNPHEYALLADKERMVEWSLALSNPGSAPNNLLAVSKNLLEADYLTKDNAAEIWARRKKLFLKPLTSFGAKGSYRGEGISRSHFEQLVNNNCLAQEYCPAPELVFEADGYPATKLKYDLRFYAYQDRVQMVIARLYQGQLTNLKTPLGGFAPVIFE